MKYDEYQETASTDDVLPNLQNKDKEQEVLTFVHCDEQYFLRFLNFRDNGQISEVVVIIISKYNLVPPPILSSR